MARIGILVLLFLSSSCSDNWNGSTKRRFQEACMEGAVKWAGSHSNAKVYCDCVLQKIISKYPDEEDGLAHIDILAKDTDLINCRREILQLSQ